MLLHISVPRKLARTKLVLQYYLRIYLPSKDKLRNNVLTPKAGNMLESDGIIKMIVVHHHVNLLRLLNATIKRVYQLISALPWMPIGNAFLMITH